MLAQFEAAETPVQVRQSNSLSIAGSPELTRLAAQDQIGERFWLQVNDRFSCTYEATVSVLRPAASIDGLRCSGLADLPANVVPYLLPSRYCSLHDFDPFIAAHLAGLQGGALIAKVAEWLQGTFTYDIAASDAATTAADAYKMQRGVCRDYAHVLISIARACSIPARYASVYAPDVDPMDFHAVAEVYLEGQWHLVDPTGMTTAERTAIIGVGRDATDVAFLTSFGDLRLVEQKVQVSEAIS